MRNDVHLVPDQRWIQSGSPIPEQRWIRPGSTGGSDRNRSKLNPDLRAATAQKAVGADGVLLYEVPAMGSATFTSALYWFIPLAIVVGLSILGTGLLWAF